MTEDEFFVEPHGDIDVLHIQGDLDIASVGAFEGIARAAAAPGRRVVIDLTECGFIDSTGLRTLAAAYARLPEGSMLVVPAQGAVRRLFQITGFESAFPARTSLQEALSERGSGSP